MFLHYVHADFRCGRFFASGGKLRDVEELSQKQEEYFAGIYAAYDAIFVFLDRVINHLEDYETQTAKRMHQAFCNLRHNPPSELYEALLFAWFYWYIQEYIEDGSINYLGTTKDVRPYLEDCLMFMLPSHREGLPMSVMEAEAVGRGINASDCVGCRDTVIDGYNGYLVPNGDASLMADKVIWAIENPQDAIKMCSNSRKFAEDNFDQEKINQQILDVINLGSEGVDNE